MPTLADWTLLGAVLLTLFTIAAAKWGWHREFDNADPRAPGFYGEGFRRRALGAHQNGFEAFPFFAVAVVLAELRQVPQHRLDLLALAFLVARLAYTGAYLGNLPSLRSLLWGLGFAFNIAIFLLPLAPR